MTGKPMFIPSKQFLAQAAEADKMLDAMIAQWEAEGYVKVHGTPMWEKRDDEGKLIGVITL